MKKTYIPNNVSKERTEEILKEWKKLENEIGSRQEKLEKLAKELGRFEMV